MEQADDRVVTDFNKKAEVARDALAGAQAQGRNAAMMDRPMTTRMFHECSIEEKIDRLADALRLVASQTSLAGEIATRADNTANFHEHGPQGQKFVPLHAGNLSLGHIGKGWHEGPFKRVMELLR